MSKPSVFMSYEDWHYMQAAIKKASPYEVGFVGIIAEYGDQAVIEHLTLLRQEVSSGEVDFDDDAFAEYLADLASKDLLPPKFGIYSAHSHGNMGVFWSSTDEDGIRKYGMSAPWLYSSVFNTRGEAKHRIDIFEHACPVAAPQLTIDATESAIGLLSTGDAVELESKIDDIRDEMEAKIAEITKEVAKIEKGQRETAESEMKADYKALVVEPAQKWRKANSSTGKGSQGSTNGQKALPSGTGSGTTSSTNGRPISKADADRMLALGRGKEVELAGQEEGKKSSPPDEPGGDAATGSGKDVVCDIQVDEDGWGGTVTYLRGRDQVVCERDLDALVDDDTHYNKFSEDDQDKLLKSWIEVSQMRAPGGLGTAMYG